MMLTLKRYDLNVKYRAGVELSVADSFSRSFLPETTETLIPDLEVKVPISSKFLFSYLILYLTQWTSAKEKFDLDKMQPFLEVLKPFKFAAILVHHSHQSSLLFE